MKALFIGVGSIGTRHIIDFYEECKKHNVVPEIHVLRREIGQLEERLKNIVVKQCTYVEEEYDVLFITNPTYLHYDALSKNAKKAKYYFIEKPIFDKTEYDIDKLGITGENAYVAAPMRHTKIYKTFLDLLKERKVFSARIICSSYLPEWRPDIDYRKNYSAIKEMGGGVALDLIHEIDYMVGLFGWPIMAHRFGGTFSELEISSDDLATYVVEYQNMLCEVHLDYFGREYRRNCEVFTDIGTFVADFYNETIKNPNGEIINCKDIKDGEFKHEMEYFYDFINGSGKVVNSPENAYKTLQIALGKYGDK